MKTLQEFIINENIRKFDPNNPKHKEAYNDLLKWVDKQDEKKTLKGDEYFGILEYAIKQWRNDNYNDLE